jgi:hypothetical protein
MQNVAYYLFMLLLVPLEYYKPSFKQTSTSKYIK